MEGTAEVGPILVILAAEAGYSAKNPKFSLLGTTSLPGLYTMACRTSPTVVVLDLREFSWI